jgi:hypothetical protein
MAVSSDADLASCLPDRLESLDSQLELCLAEGSVGEDCFGLRFMLPLYKDRSLF